MLNSIFLEHALDGTLMEWRNTNGFLPHSIVLRLPYLEDNSIFDVLCFRIGQFIKQFAYAVCIDYWSIAQIFLTLSWMTDKSRIQYIHSTLVGWQEPCCLIAQARRSFRALCLEAMNEMERDLVIVQCFYHFVFLFI